MFLSLKNENMGAATMFLQEDLTSIAVQGSPVL